MGTSQIQGNTIPQIISNNQTPQLRGFLFNISSINFHGKLYSILKQKPCMKNILKLLAIAILFVCSSRSAEAQVLHHKKAKKEMVKQLHLTKQQKKQVKTFHKSTKEKKDVIKNNTSLTEPQKKEQLAQLKNEKHTKLEAILTAEQKEKLKQATENKPHRGVTNMPNERTAK